MSDGLSQQASQPPLAGGGGDQVPSVISTGVINTGLSITLRLGAVSMGQIDGSLAQTAALTVATGSTGRSMSVSQLTGADTVSLGSSGRSLAVSQLTGSETVALGTSGRSLSADSTILGRGFVQSESTAGGVLWTSITNDRAEDGAKAQWLKSEGVGAGAATTDSGTLTAINPKLGSTPSGWSRTKVEALITNGDVTSGLLTGDTADFTVDLQDKTGAALQTVRNVHRTGNQNTASHTDTVDVTAAVAGISDADLALTKFFATATFARVLVATGTRSFTVTVDSFSLRVTYTRTGIS